MAVPPRWLAAALRLLPGSFRERFGDELTETVNRLATDARAAGGRRRHWRYAARELADIARLAVEVRGSRRTSAVGDREGMGATFRDDLAWALRYLRRRPLFACAVTVTLAASVAAATTALGVADAVLWRALPYADSERLVFVWEEPEVEGRPQPARVTAARYAAWRDTDGVFESTALFGATGFTLEGRDGAISVRGVAVSAGYFQTLGIQPAFGRSFRAADEQPGHHRVVILSSAFWRQHFGARTDVVGETLLLSGEPYSVIGVMPPVTLPAWPVNPAGVILDADARQIWVPLARSAEFDQSARAHVFGVVARLAPGVDHESARQRLNLATDASAPDPHRARLMPLREQFVAGTRTALLALAAATLAILLIACANLAAIYASAFESRRAELAVRAALGAGLGRLVRQLATEALLLASAGTAGGFLLARLALNSVPGVLPPSVPLLTTPSADLRTGLMAACLALATVVLIAGWPVVRLVSSQLSPRGVVARPRGLVYRGLVVGQVAVTTALAVAGSLLGQSLAAVRRQDPGFAVERVLVASVALPRDAAGEAGRVVAAEQRVLEDVAALPRVSAAATAYDHPLEANWSEAPTLVGDDQAGDQARQVELRIVSPGYFETLGVELLDGRTLADRDAFSTPGVAVVNEAFARDIGGRAIGRRLRNSTPGLLYPGAPTEFEIVGVVANERIRGLERPAQAAYYLSTRQFPQPSFSLIARTRDEPLAASADVRAAARAAAPGTTVDPPTSLERILADQLAPRRITADLIGGFAITALALAALGLYGLLAVLVSSRQRELGVRLALGASPTMVARLVVSDSLRTALAGVGFGVGLSLAAGRLVQGLLVDVSPRDPLTLAVVVAALLTVALVAALAPARRAARIDPVDALRADG